MVFHLLMYKLHRCHLLLLPSWYAFLLASYVDPSCTSSYQASYSPNANLSQALAPLTFIPSNTLPWCLDTSASCHVTLDIQSLSFCKAYHGSDQLHMGNDKGLKITNICISSIFSSISNLSLRLNDVLHFPDIYKCLLSV